MCGIFACFLTDSKKTFSKEEGFRMSLDSKKITFEALKLLEYRGYDSFGIYSIMNGAQDLDKHVGTVSDAKINFNKKYNISLGHTRWATHGKVSKLNTHPHISNDKNLIIVHNGIFENYNEIKKELIKNKYKFYSETDTEVLINYLDFSFKNNHLNEFIKNIKGSNAFVVYNKKENKLYVYKNGSALYITEDENNSIYISSDVTTLIEFSKNIYSLKDKSFIEIKDVKLDKISELEKVEVKNVKVVSLNGYKHFTIKEIYDQKDTIKNAYENGEVENFSDKEIIFTGCGTAYNVCLVAKYLFAKKGMNINTIPANEFVSFSKLLNKNTLLFAISQSGETADTIIFAKKVLEVGGTVLSILNNMNSTLAQISTKVIDIESGKEIAVASTKAFTAQVASILKILDFNVEESVWEGINKIFKDKKLAEEIKKIAEKIVKKYKAENLFIIGKGIASAIGTEISLKIKETSYIHAESFAAGELKHGVLSLIEKNVITIILDTEKEFEDELENSAMQIKSRDGILIGIGINNKKYYNHFIQIPDLKAFTFLAGTIAGQMLAYYIATSKKLNPDKPRNLAKSVTVK